MPKFKLKIRDKQHLFKTRFAKVFYGKQLRELIKASVIIKILLKKQESREGFPSRRKH